MPLQQPHLPLQGKVALLVVYKAARSSVGPLHWQEARAAGLLLEALAKQSLDYNYKARFI